MTFYPYGDELSEIAARTSKILISVHLIFGQKPQLYAYSEHNEKCQLYALKRKTEKSQLYALKSENCFRRFLSLHIAQRKV